MQTLIDWHQFRYCASVPWPHDECSQIDWINGVKKIENWLNWHIGNHLIYWAWNDSYKSYNIGVAFKQDKDRTLFLITWS